MSAGPRQRLSSALIRRANIRRSLGDDRAAVALTFDDGPDPEHTTAILDELAHLDVPATFFLVGARARAHPVIVQRILAEGHAVGSHSSSHPEPWRLNTRELTREYRHGRAAVEEAAQQPVALFRPPKGFVNTKGAVAMLVARVRPWLWTIDPRDWEPDARVDDIVAGCRDLAAGDVVLLHDAIEGPLAPSALDRSATRTALASIVDIARQRGLKFATLT